MELPISNGQDPSSFIIGSFKDPDMNELLQSFSGEQVNEWELKVIAIEKIEDFKKVILYLSAHLRKMN